jgi:hypothetical protein
MKILTKRKDRQKTAEMPAQGLFGKKPCKGEYLAKVRTLLPLIDWEQGVNIPLSTSC